MCGNSVERDGKSNKLAWHSQAQAKNHSTNIAKIDISHKINLYTKNIKKKFMQWIFAEKSIMAAFFGDQNLFK